MPLTEKDAQLVAREVLRGIEWAKSGEDDPQNLQSHITTLRRQVEATNTRTKQWDDIDGPRSASPRVPGWLLAVILVLVVLAGLVGYQLPV